MSLTLMHLEHMSSSPMADEAARARTLLRSMPFIRSAHSVHILQDFLTAVTQVSLESQTQLYISLPLYLYSVQ